MFGGSNLGNLGETIAEDHSSHGRPASISITLPPLAVVVFRSALMRPARRLAAAQAAPAHKTLEE